MIKLKTALLTSALVLGASQTMAAELNSPFYLPETGNFLSSTSLEYYRAMNKHNELYNEGTYANEELSYGINDNWSVYGTIGNHFDTDRDFNNDHNFDYSVGTRYNHNFGQILTQVGAEYYTFKPKSWGDEDADNDWSKFLTVNAKVGLDTCGGIIPYVGLSATNNINDNDAELPEMTYSAKIGAYKAWDALSTDVALRWEFEKNRDNEDDLKKDYNEVYVDAAVNYMLNDTMSAGVYGSYLVGDSRMGDIDYDYTMGANFKLLF